MGGGSLSTMTPARRSRSAVLGALLLGAALGLASCGGGGTARSVADDGKQVPSSGDVDAIIGTLLQGVTGSRGDKVDAPGKVRFVNLVRSGDTPTDIDVWWGQPDEGDKAASVAYGKVSTYLTPRTSKGFDNAVYSVTAVGDSAVLWSWDRFSPEGGTRRTVMLAPTDDATSVSQSDLDEQPGHKDFMGTEYFPAPDSGKVRVLWRPIGRVLDMTDKILAVAPGAGGTCFTNGSGIAGPDGNQVDGSTFQVDPGTQLALFDTCAGTPATGTPVSGAVVASTGPGRSLLIAYLGPGDRPTLLSLPVRS